MRNLSLAYGNSRQAKTWVNKTIGFEELKERLKVTIRTPESAEEYAKMNKAQRDRQKTTVGFVGGVLKAAAEKSTPWNHAPCCLWTVTASQRNFLITTKPHSLILPCFYTTHSSTEENPRGKNRLPSDP